MEELNIFFEAEHFIEKKEKNTYKSSQLGGRIHCMTQKYFDWEDSEIVLLGCGEYRGSQTNLEYCNSADAVREELYKMYCWHTAIKIADAGNIMQGNSINDTRAALLAVLHEIHIAGKVAIILGGSHDLTLQQYEVYKMVDKRAVISVADMLLDLDETESITADSFIMDMLGMSPNYVLHYNHIGFQSYFAHPTMIQTLDKLRFDFFRLGKVRENIEEMEPVLRSSNILSIDMNVVRYSDAMANRYGSPNGLNGEEICQLTRYAGMSNELTSLGIYGFIKQYDNYHMTAKLLAQMIWYFVDGFLVRKVEPKLTEKDEFILFNLVFTDNDTEFLKSKRTNRWWMKLPNNQFIPCSYNDYLQAANNIMPERWLREQERLA